MITISKPSLSDVALLTDMGRETFVESHGSSASPSDIEQYIQAKYNQETATKELCDERNIFHVLYYKDQAAGFSKIVLNSPSPHIDSTNVCKLDRLYLLNKFCGLKLGWELFTFNLQLSQSSGQAGMWLFVWKENHRAVAFYKRIGFEIIGHYDFKISEGHSNPNFVMWKSH